MKLFFLAWEGECFCVFACQARGAWVVGIGNQKRNRRDAGKIGLAAAAAATRMAHNEPPPRLVDNYLAFATCLCEMKRLVG